jgi:hypothetical protein
MDSSVTLKPAGSFRQDQTFEKFDPVLQRAVKVEMDASFGVFGRYELRLWGCPCHSKATSCIKKILVNFSVV